MAKGGQFERDIAKLLSKWWTRDLPEPRDDIYWRTGGSGGRATTRGKKGIPTANSYGDIGYLDPLGKPLLDLLVIECKRGYTGHTLHDLLDRREKGAKGVYEKWLLKAEEDRRAARVKYWLLITRRDRRTPLVIMPSRLFDELMEIAGARLETLPLFAHFGVRCGGSVFLLVVLTLKDFLARVTPSHIEYVTDPRVEVNENAG